MHDSLSMLYKMRQGTQETNDHFLARFKANVTTAKLTGGSHIFFSPKLAGIERQDLDPTTVATMYELMTKRSGAIAGQRSQGSGTRRNGLQLVQQAQCLSTNEQDDMLIPGTDGRVFQVICYNCNKKGHYVSCCSEPSTRVAYKSEIYWLKFTNKA